MSGGAAALDFKLLRRFIRVNGVAIRARHQLWRFRVVRGVDHLIHDFSAAIVVTVDWKWRGEPIAQIGLEAAC